MIKVKKYNLHICCIYVAIAQKILFNVYFFGKVAVNTHEINENSTYEISITK